MAHKPYHEMTLEDVRTLVKETRQRGLQIQKHYKRLEQEYSDWEDQINEVEKIILQLQEDTGINKEEVYKEQSMIDELINFSTSNVDTNESILGEPED